MAKPKLAYIPATIGDKVYSILPSNGVGDFDFTRGTVATRINAQGLIEEVASGENRLNYSLLDGEVVGCPHLLLEPARTNLIQYSEDFSQYSDVSGADIFANTTISPDGTLNASRVSFGSSEFSRIFINTSTSSNTYTFTLYAKSDTSKKFRFRISDTSGTQYSEDFITTSKWQRFSYEFIGDPSTCAICNSSDSNSGSIDIYGFQLEEGSFPTSYIPTNGEVNGVTRAAETCYDSGDAATFNDSEGVLMAEISAFEDTMNFEAITLSDGTTNNEVRLYFSSTQNKLSYNLKVNGATQLDGALVDVVFKNNNKILIKYKQNNSSLWVNGFKLLSYNILDVFSNNVLNEISFSRGNGSTPFYGNTKQLQYFDTTDINLEQLTSWDSFRAMAEGQQYNIE